MLSPRLTTLAAALLASTCAHAVIASPALTAQISFVPFNNGPSGTVGAGGQSTPYNGGPGASLDYTTSFTGINQEGDTQTVDVHAQGEALAEAGALHASATLSVSNPFYNAANPAYVNGDFSVNPDGVPDLLEIYSTAKFNDSVLIDGDASLATLKVTVTLDGTTTYDGGLSTDPFGSPAYTQASVAVTDSTGATCGTCGSGSAQGAGTFNKSFDLYIPVSGPGAADLGLQLYLYNDFNLDNFFGYDESGSYSVSMDFSHTLTITGIEGLNDSGAPVTINSITGTSGKLYPVVSVPEPAETALMAAGLLAVGLLARKRHTH